MTTGKLKKLIRYCKARIRELPAGRRGHYWRLYTNFKRLYFSARGMPLDAQKCVLRGVRPQTAPCGYPQTR